MFFRFAGRVVLLACMAALLPGAAREPATVRLTSLDWPPYTGARLPAQGVSSAVVAAAFAAMGQRTEIAFYPWSRATALVRGKSAFVAYFPEYESAQLRSDFLLSDPIGEGPLGFAEHVDAPVHWRSLEDLAAYRVGIVTGYVNTDQFDRRVREKRQPVDYARDDQQNLIKLAARRVPLALVDRRVFDYLVRHDPAVRKVAAKLRFHPRLLESKLLFVCFRRTPEGEAMRAMFNAGLKKIDLGAVTDAAYRKLDGAASGP